MRAPLSIIIPTLNAQADLPDTLAALVEGLQANLLRELVVSDGGSSDQSCDLAEAAGAKITIGSAGRGGQLRRGAEMAGGDWLLFIHADTQLSTGWAEQVSRHMATSDKAAYFKLKFRAPGFAPKWVAGWANLRSRVFGLPYGDQGLLISRVLYDQVGGYADISLMEDVAIARALRGRMRGLSVVAMTNADRYQAVGWLRQGTRNLWRLLRYLAGADPARLGQRY